jgi:hypothetical protein
MPRQVKPVRRQKRRATRPAAARRRPSARRSTPSAEWTIAIDEHLSIRGEGIFISWSWAGPEHASPDEDEAAAAAITHVRDLEQRAYDAARRLKSEDAEDSPDERRQIAADRRVARRDAARLRRFVRVMEER